MEQRTLTYAMPYRLILPLLALLSLLPTLFFPISPDHAIFYFGGKVLLDGGVLYRDFVDIKPPIIYELFAFIQAVFGGSEVSLRLFGFVWQALTLASMHHVFTRWLRDERVVHVSILVYALSYTVSNYTSTLQCETLAALPLLWMLYLYGRRRKRYSSWLVAGMLYAVIVHLKYTLGIVVLPLLLTDWLVRKPALRVAAVRYILFLAGFLTLSFAVYAPLFTGGGLASYLDVLNFVQHYAALQSLDATWFGVAAESLLRYFGDKYSLLFTVAAGIGIGRLYRRRWTLPVHEQEFSMLFALQAALLLLSVIIERKFIPYHFSRLYIVLSPFVALGLHSLWEYGAAWWRSGGWRRVLLIVAVLPGLLATPLPRFMRTVWSGVLFFADRTRYDQLYTNPNPHESVAIRADQRQVAGYVRARRQPEENILVVAVHAAPVYYFLQPERAPMLSSTPFYIADWCAPQWKQHFEQELRTADWLIVQTNDLHPDITGVDATSMEFLSTHPVYGAVLSKRYREVRHFLRFVVYRAEQE